MINSNQLQQEINKQIFAIADREAFGLPEWDILYKAADYAKREPSAINCQYATDLFNTIKNLLEVVENYHFHIESVDFDANTYNCIKKSFRSNEVGVKVDKPTTIEYRGGGIRETFADLEKYNSQQKVYQIRKYEEFTKTTDDNVLVIEKMFNDKKVVESIDKTFLPVIDTSSPKCTFERFLSLYGYEPKMDKVNKFNSQPLNEVKEYFSGLFNSIDNGIKALSEEKQKLFFESAFQGIAIDGRLKFDVDIKASKVIAHFHRYYSLCKDMYEPKMNCTDKYIKLLSDHFEGYEYEKIKNNFRS